MRAGRPSTAAPEGLFRRLSGEAAVAFAALAMEQGDDAVALLGSKVGMKHRW